MTSVTFGGLSSAAAAAAAVLLAGETQAAAGMFLHVSDTQTLEGSACRRPHSELLYSQIHACLCG